MEKSAEELASMASARKLLNDMERKSGIELTKHQQMASYTSRAWQATARSTRDVAGQHCEGHDVSPEMDGADRRLHRPDSARAALRD